MRRPPLLERTTAGAGANGMNREYHAGTHARRRILIDLDAETFDLPGVEFNDLATLDRAGLAALRAAIEVLELALAGDAR